MPKGATLTHHNIVNNAIATGRCMRFSEADALCIPVPLYHCFGMVLGVLACAATGAKMVFPGEGFDPRATLAAVEAERCTALHGVPTMFIAELDHADFARFDLTSLRTGIMAGAPCPIEVMKRVEQQMHMHEVTIGYGMTETSPVSFQSATDDPLDKRVTTVGRILPHLEVKIVDADGGVVPVGEKGELCTQGYSVMQGYWNDLERTRRRGPRRLDAHRRPGDAGRAGLLPHRRPREGHGDPRRREHLPARDRGVPVPPPEGGRGAGVRGARRPSTAKRSAPGSSSGPAQACTEDEIRDFCRDQIAHYKVPRYIRFVEALPVTVTGKAQKFVMREAMMRELGLTAAERRETWICVATTLRRPPAPSSPYPTACRNSLIITAPALGSFRMSAVPERRAWRHSPAEPARL